MTDYDTSAAYWNRRYGIAEPPAIPPDLCDDDDDDPVQPLNTCNYVTNLFLTRAIYVTTFLVGTGTIIHRTKTKWI